MKLCLGHGNYRGRQSGFTMAEIAIALGVIAIALIAILGVLPSGLQVQRDNREETIINQDARLLLQALKSGGRDGASDLGSFVVTTKDGNNVAQAVGGGVHNINGGIPTAALLRLLSDPNGTHTVVFSAISGGLASRGSDVGFRYQVVSEVISPLNRQLFGNSADFVLPPDDVSLTNQLFDVRLRFSWPVTVQELNASPNATNKLASEVNRYVVRALISGVYSTNSGLIYAQEYYQPKP